MGRKFLCAMGCGTQVDEKDLIGVGADEYMPLCDDCDRKIAKADGDERAKYRGGFRLGVAG